MSSSNITLLTEPHPDYKLNAEIKRSESHKLGFETCIEALKRIESRMSDKDLERIGQIINELRKIVDEA